MGYRCAKQHDILATLVAHIDLIEVAIVAPDHLDDFREILLQLRTYLRVAIVVESAEADEKHGYFAMLIDETTLAGLKPLGDRGVYKARERGNRRVGELIDLRQRR